MFLKQAKKEVNHYSLNMFKQKLQNKQTPWLYSI